MRFTTKLLILAAAAFAMLCFAGCSGLNVYSNADKYDPGSRDVSEKIEELDIGWNSGEVSVVRHDLSTISVSETCSDKLELSEQVHTWVDGKTLRIRFAKSGEMFFFGSPKKKLEIRIPKDMSFKDIKLDGSSCDSRFEAVSADHIYADVSSGNVNIIDCSAKTFDVDTSSGDTKIVQLGESDSISVDCSSGSVDIKAEKVGKLRLDSSSGKVESDIKDCADVRADTSSGDVTLEFGCVPDKTSIDTSSGDVRVLLPKDADFTAEVDTSSGEFYTDFSCSSKGDTYTCGSGRGKFTFDTSSGSVEIRKK